MSQWCRWAWARRVRSWCAVRTRHEVTAPRKPSTECEGRRVLKSIQSIVQLKLDLTDFDARSYVALVLDSYTSTRLALASPRAAYEWYHHAAAAGCIEAVRLGGCSYVADAIGFARDLSEARYWLQRAAATGD